jgi:hypothetical protein
MNERKIASVGMNEQHTRFFQQLLKLYDGKLKSKWLFLGDFDPQRVVQTMGSEVSDTDILFIDVDDEHGKRAWYTLEVLFDENKMVALSSEPQYSGARWFVSKTTLNWAVGQGTDVVDILNGVSDTIK